jgi:hypothetical protein
MVHQRKGLPLDGFSQRDPSLITEKNFGSNL